MSSFSDPLPQLSDANKIRQLPDKFLITFCTLIIAITSGWQSKAVAQKNSVAASIMESDRSLASAFKTRKRGAKASKVTFDPPAGERPKNTAGGASRSIGRCIKQAENMALPFTPLIPSSNQGLTVASHPTVLAYLPKTSADRVYFSWHDESSNNHYQTILPIKNQGGIVSLTLPQNAPPLEIGKNYKWSLAIMCDKKLQPDSPTIEGQIKRVAVESNLSVLLSNAGALETAAIYGEAGIWYETLNTLAKLKMAQPRNPTLSYNWQELLNSVELEKFATIPLIK